MLYCSWQKSIVVGNSGMKQHWELWNLYDGCLWKPHWRLAVGKKCTFFWRKRWPELKKTSTKPWCKLLSSTKFCTCFQINRLYGSSAFLSRLRWDSFAHNAIMPVFTFLLFYFMSDASSCSFIFLLYAHTASIAWKIV